jgi:hypothetical protein
MSKQSENKNKSVKSKGEIKSNGLKRNTVKDKIIHNSSFNMEEDISQPSTPNPVLKKQVISAKSQKVGSDINNKSLEIRSLR